MKKKNKRRWIPWAFIAVLIAASVLYSVSRNRGTFRGQIGKVERKDLVQRITVSGYVVPLRRTVVNPPYAGYVKKLYVKVGETVRAGQPVVSVVQNLGVTEEVFPLRAPFAGTVVQVLKLEGEYCEDVSKTIARIDDLTSLYINADMPEMDLPKVHIGQEVSVRATPITSRTYGGVVREIFRAAKEKQGWDNSKVEFPIRIELIQRDDSIRSGMSALVDVIVAKRPKALALGLEYVEKRRDGPGGSERFFATFETGERREIKVGIQTDDSFEIVEGLKEGDRIRQVDFLSIPQSGPV